MSLSNAALRKLAALNEKREKLANELSAIEAQIMALLGGTASSSEKASARRSKLVEKTRSTKPTQKGAKRGKTGELILDALKKAGSNGISVKELSSKLGIKNQNVHVWFATTGKKHAEIEKTGKGIFRLKKSGAKVEEPEAIKKPAKMKVSKSPKRKTSAPKSKLAGKK
jgi:hypothetical protein